MIQIRTAKTTDANHICETESTLFAKPGKEPAILKAIRSAATTFLVAEDESGVVGHVLLGKGDDVASAKVLVIAVRKNLQREGIGSALMDAAKKSLKNGKLRLHTRVDVRNLAAQKFLAKSLFSNQQEVSTETGNFYPFMYEAPMDNLSSAHIAMIAAKRKRDSKAC